MRAAASPKTSPIAISTTKSSTMTRNVASLWVASSMTPIISAMPAGSLTPASPSSVVPERPPISRPPNTENTRKPEPPASDVTEYKTAARTATNTGYKTEIERFQGSLAGLAEIVVFIALGLTIDITHLPAQTWLHGAVLALVLAVLARPLAVALTLTGSSLSRAERAFIAWSGLKRAVPILLAAFAILGGVDDADNVYGLVFVVVLLSVLGQGTLVPSVAHRLGIPMHDQALRPWQLSVGLTEKPHGVHEFSVARDATADGQTIAALHLQPGDWVVRDGRPLSPEDPTRLAAGDQVFVLADPTRHEPLARLFTTAD